MNALVISGGGCKGAFAGGVAEYLISERRNNYDIFIGTSTGSLMVPVLAAGQIERLKHTYSNVCQNDIFRINPFRIRRKNGHLRVSINHFNMIRMFLKGAKTFGDSSNLRKLIEKTFPESDFNAVKSSGKKVIVSVSNLSKNLVEYKHLNDYEYEDFIDWTWISANSVPFMSLVVKDGFEYADGGFGTLIPIQEAINLGADKIDVIVLNPRVKDVKKEKSRNAFGLLNSAFDFMISQIANDDLAIGFLEARHSDVVLNFYHTPNVLTSFPYVFEPAEMARWWQDGYDFAKHRSPGFAKVKNKVA